MGQTGHGGNANVGIVGRDGGGQTQVSGAAQGSTGVISGDLYAEPSNADEINTAINDVGLDVTLNALAGKIKNVSPV